MNTRRSLVLLILLLVLSVQSVCAKLSDADSLKLIASLDTFYEGLKKGNQPVKEGLLDSLLTEDAIEWFQDIIMAVEYADSAELSERPFFEVISILGLRYYYKEFILDDLELPKAFKFYMQRGYMNKVLRMTSFGDFWIEKEEFGFRGLKKAPKVPILHFRLENEKWRFDLPQTLEVVSRSTVSLGQKKGWSTIEAALEILDNLILKDVIDETLLVP